MGQWHIRQREPGERERKHGSIRLCSLGELKGGPSWPRLKAQSGGEETRKVCGVHIGNPLSCRKWEATGDFKQVSRVTGFVF